MHSDKNFYLQDFWAKQEGFDDIEAWIERLDTPDKIEAHRTRRHLGLAEIQTKQFENVLDEFFVGDEIPQYSGHYFIREDFKCDGCSSADDYLYLIGKGRDDQLSLHDHLHSICRHLHSDFEPYGQRERNGADCSCECKHFLKLPGKLGMDWGVCANPASPRAGLLTFEHQGCEQFEDYEIETDE